MSRHDGMYDYTDIDIYELKLIRVGHSLWAMLRRERRQNRVDVGEIKAIVAGIETIMDLKSRYRAELKVRRAEKSQKLRQKFASKGGGFDV